MTSYDTRTIKSKVKDGEGDPGGHIQEGTV